MNGRTHSEGQGLGTDQAAAPQHSLRKSRGRLLATLALVASFTGLIDHAAAGLPVVALAPGMSLPILPSSTQFDITGFPTDATVNNPADPHSGGTVTLNGHVIVVPAETIVILPASALTWAELFTMAPAPYAPNHTGMALNDVPKPLTTYEFQAVGNRVIGGPAGADLYIAGLVHVTQQDLNGGAGYINFMDYATGEMRVGGTLGDPTTGARVQINDPAVVVNGVTTGTGRYGRASDPAKQDRRFQVDQDNPTIASASGFPMCFPRTLVEPTLANDDPLCPLSNRPVDILPTGTVFSQLFVMSNPANIVVTDPNKQAPFEVGDYVTFSGTLTADALGTFISAHTIIDNASISTFPGTDPAYVSIEVGLIGTGGLTVFGAGEAAIRTRFEGMSTDETRPIYLYGIDMNADGTSSDRYFGTIMPDPGTPIGAVRGRWRFRPPCANFGVIVGKPDKQCVNGPDNSYLPPPREIRAVIAAAGNDAGANPAVLPLPTNPTFAQTANGISYGQYHAPIGEYIFPENTPGNPIVENNFNTIPFLTVGGYASITGVVAGQLNPWPSNIPPAAVCNLAVPSFVSVPATLNSGASVAVVATSTGTTPTFHWSTTPAPGGGTFANPSLASTTYTAPALAAGAPNLSVVLHMTVSNACSLALTIDAPVTIIAPPAPVLQNPTVNQVAPLSMFVSQSGTFGVTGTDPNIPATPLAFHVTQIDGPTVTPSIVAPTTSTSATVSVTTGAVAGVAHLAITATNGTGQTSAPITATITINAVPADAVVITDVLYRTGKQRLIITATDTPVGTAVLKLQPYVYVKNGVDTIFNPATLGDVLTNGGGGLYSMTLVGAPQPKAGATITVNSSLGGSGSTTVIRIRQ